MRNEHSFTHLCISITAVFPLPTHSLKGRDVFLATDYKVNEIDREFRTNLITKSKTLVGFDSWQRIVYIPIFTDYQLKLL